MKKHILLAAVICSFFIACNSKQNSNGQSEGSDDTSAKNEKKITKRDYSINAYNAYNDIFLDSAAVENFISKNKVADSVLRRMRSFYNARNYQFAWFSSKGLTEQALGFWNLYNYAAFTETDAPKDPALKKVMENLMADTDYSVKASDKNMVNTELSLTSHLIVYTLSNYEKGFVKRKEMEHFVPIKKEDAMVLADSLLTKKHKDNKYFDDVNNAYKQLKEQLKIYYDIQKNGGWPQIAGDAKQYKKGKSSPMIATLKKRLQITGDMPVGDSGQVFDDSLQNGIKLFQQRLGYNQNGVITTGLIKDLNVTASQRVEQLYINLNRMRWMPQEPDGKLILVNLPEFVLHFVDGKNKVFDMDVVVGKEGHNTVLFTGKLSTIVFSPYWNVPTSIVKKEIVPHMASNANYIEQQNMEITGYNGSLPVVRQKPGEKNSLGRVKFLFPNSFDIYFHDTPAKSLFSQDKRAYSHGCIRLSDPVKMAQYLLKDNSSWPPDKIEEAMNQDHETYVTVKDPIPVFITYYTAWVDENGMLNFRDDIYSRDADVAAKMYSGK
ncbi:MAG: L,D-transpeptidase family protein [Chitinophagaceae bacterium]|nr:L,D-transpeptidase family protein [Chitinophagaceae bacterium]